VKRIVPLLSAVLLVAACAKGTPNNPILGPGESPTPLVQPEYVGIGRFQNLGEITTAQTFGGVPYVTFVEVRQPKASMITHEDVSGFIYAYQGLHQLSRNDGEKVDFINQGAAAWLPGTIGDIDHVNGTDQDQIWYFISLRSIMQRNQKLAYPSYRIAYQTDDLRQPPAGKKLVHVLGYITMDVGGRTSAHSHGGTEALYVLKGKVDLKTNDGKTRQLGEGQGASVNPGVVMQLRVVGDQPVQILTYFVTPEGDPWQTNVQTLP